MFEPQVLVGVRLNPALEKQMNDTIKSLGISKEQFLLDAVRFYRSHCVHTQGMKKPRSRK